ncbi:MAG: hypothetical protein CBD74_01585 [Saprospirales bacterium TMED214]|nr:MAG: hypothetical protein CBD74_01585 [Saprospirales bacterium TMED214]
MPHRGVQQTITAKHGGPKMTVHHVASSSDASNEPTKYAFRLIAKPVSIGIHMGHQAAPWEHRRNEIGPTNVFKATGDRRKPP